jgi:hypothetical protein
VSGASLGWPASCTRPSASWTLRSDAQEALARLGDVVAALPVETTRETASIWGWPERRYLDDRTSVRLLLGDQTVYGELARRQSQSPRGHALGELKTAWARIVAGDVREGLEDATEVVSGLPPEHRTATVQGAVTSIGNALPDDAHALPAARELRALTEGQSA